ncbi:MAG: serine/threonine protein kinase [Chloroflexi bacterium]|nr:serine/threonine protein kinase [Chloroflexota bacterium]
MVDKILGHYEILEPLGKGGMGEVYRARDTTLKRDVAIKVFPEELSADPDRLARLKREAHLLAALNHANIATIYALEEDQGTSFLVLELVKGESLEQRLSKGPLPVEKALDLCKQIAEALEAAHGEGIIHRDLKPANILITPEGKAKVLDFGLAKTVEAAIFGWRVCEGRIRQFCLPLQQGPHRRSTYSSSAHDKPACSQFSGKARHIGAG